MNAAFTLRMLGICGGVGLAGGLVMAVLAVLLRGDSDTPPMWIIVLGGGVCGGISAWLMLRTRPKRPDDAGRR
jgi:hypothetical protein